MEFEITCCLTPIDYPTPGVPVRCPDCNSILAVDDADFTLLASAQALEHADRVASGMFDY